jgi:carboxymethylenebutenolidase
MQRSLLYILFAILPLFSACNSDEDDKSFKDLSRDESFKKSHEDPADIGKIALTGEMVHFPVGKGPKAGGYLVKSNHPGRKWLIVFHEWWGLNDYIKRESDRYANSLKDVNVLALDLYDGKVADKRDDASKLVNETSDKRIEDIIKGALVYVGDTSKIATIGWCFGGGWSLQTAILSGNKDIGCVMYYGMPEKEMSKIQLISCPVLGIFANKDQGITPSIVNEFETRMRYSNRPLILKRFDANHAFANPSNPDYDKQATAEANNVAMRFLKNQFQTVR